MADHIEIGGDQKDRALRIGGEKQTRLPMGGQRAAIGAFDTGFAEGSKIPLHQFVRVTGRQAHLDPPRQAADPAMPLQEMRGRSHNIGHRGPDIAASIAVFIHGPGHEA